MIKDKRKNYYLMLDTETCNGQLIDNKLNLNDSLVYDIGVAVVDKKGNVYDKDSLVVSDIFFGYNDLMQTCYYADKLPDYFKKIKSRERKIVNVWEARDRIINLLENWECKAIVAHNAGFDYRALNTTLRYLTKSKYRYFIPKKWEWYDTLKMANDVILTMPTYRQFCQQNNFMTNHKKPRPRATAEILYRFLSSDLYFEEEHQGLDDVMIEKEIFSYCLRKHKKMRKKLFEN